MNPDEAWIGNVVFIGTVGLAIWDITALLQAQSEGARRVRLVIGGAIAFGVAAMLFAISGPVIVAVELVTLGPIIWIFKGFKKSSPSPKRDATSPPPHIGMRQRTMRQSSSIPNGNRCTDVVDLIFGYNYFFLGHSHG